MILNRAITPLPYEKQKQYHNILDQQVDIKRTIDKCTFNSEIVIMISYDTGARKT